MSDDERYMARAIEFARRATFTSPNPRVGALVVRDGAPLGEGFHRGPGAPHAEIEALAGVDAAGSTLYVNLEPCCHDGLTPPCAPVLADAGVARVVAAIEDPDARMRGRGFAYLRRRGVEVATGVLAGEALLLNRAYLHQRTTGSPFVSLKLALSLDGRMSARDGSARWITGGAARRAVHVRRAAVDAVMVGSGTVLRDDPRLSARHRPDARRPARIVVDSSGRVLADAAVFAPDAHVIVATTDRAPHEIQTAWKEAGAEVLVLGERGGGVDLRALLEVLGRRGMLEVLCEGGARLATSLLRERLVDRLELNYGSLLLGEGGAALADIGVNTMADASRWRCTSAERCGEDVVVVLEPSAAVRPEGPG
ncbi:MAG: bifunctional diaminohydroxyphosphoribosylaminopyrimidine deaminase/5-amino-6-(5-phosphoribosylamino)uracil reductase RibD [Actinomycetota bacterium]